MSEGAAVSPAARARGRHFPTAISIQPTIVHQLGKDNFLMRNEVFGPVLAVTPFKDAEVLALANGTEFGLAAGVWTRHQSRAQDGEARVRHGVGEHLSRADVQFALRRLSRAVSAGRTASRRSTSTLQTKSVWVRARRRDQDPFIMKV